MTCDSDSGGDDKRNCDDDDDDDDVDGSGDDADGDVLAGVLVLGLCFCAMMTLFAVLVMGVAATTARLLLRVRVTMMISMMVTEPMVSRHALTAAALVCRLL